MLHLCHLNTSKWSQSFSKIHNVNVTILSLHMVFGNLSKNAGIHYREQEQKSSMRTQRTKETVLHPPRQPAHAPQQTFKLSQVRRWRRTVFKLSLLRDWCTNWSVTICMTEMPLCIMSTHPLFLLYKERGRERCKREMQEGPAWPHTDLCGIPQH